MKGFSSASIPVGAFMQSNQGYNMVDVLSTYKFTYEFLINKTVEATYSLCGGQDTYGFGMQIRTGGTWILYFKDKLGAIQSLNGLAFSDFVVGYNKMELTFDLPSKTVSATVNGHTLSIVHTLDSQLGLDGKYFRFFSGATDSIEPLYFKFSENLSVLAEYIFSEQSLMSDKITTTSVRDDFKNLIGGSNSIYFVGTVGGVTYGKYFKNQDIANPFKFGYDLYWNQNARDYLRVNPINSLGDSINEAGYALLKRVLPNELPYHVFEYLQMPDLPIFDTSDRLYWKVAIEADPMYVGGIAGKERYFHKTWLNFNWINSYIEEDYKGLLNAVDVKVNAVGQDNVTTSISDIFLLPSKYNSLNKSISTLNPKNLGSWYISRTLGFGRTDNNQEYLLFDYVGATMVMQRGLNLCCSLDNGKSWNIGVPVSSINSLSAYPVSLVRILSTGRIIVFSSYKDAYYSDDNLATLTPCTTLDSAGNPYVFHTPVSSSLPGGYFMDFHNFIEDGSLLLFANYANSAVGAAPSNFWYSLDMGVTWKVFWTFGQNPRFTDNGSTYGGTGGTLLGDASNSIITRHVHAINKGSDGNYYACTGDNNFEMHFLKLSYNSGLDQWTVSDMLLSPATSWQRLRGIGIIEYGGYIYWGSDGTQADTVGGIVYNQRGIYRCLPYDLNDITKHELLQELTDEAFYFAAGEDGVIYCGMDAGNAFIYTSVDHGATWVQRPLIFNNESIRPAHYSQTKKLVIMSRYVFQQIN